jgi:hypothetical protein
VTSWFGYHCVPYVKEATEYSNRKEQEYKQTGSKGAWTAAFVTKFWSRDYWFSTATVAGGAGSAVLKATGATSKVAAATTQLEAGVGATNRSVWSLEPLKRGTVIEDALAMSEYSDWYRAGSLSNGNFPLIDFQKGNNLLSLKTVDTGGSGWLKQMQSHIDDLGTRGATVDGNPANMMLDLRVQPGGADAAQSLVGYGEKAGVRVFVTEFP